MKYFLLNVFTVISVIPSLCYFEKTNKDGDYEFNNFETSHNSQDVVDETNNSLGNKEFYEEDNELSSGISDFGKAKKKLLGSSSLQTYSDNGYLDDNKSSANVMTGENIQISGNLKVYSAKEQRDYKVGQKDEDWFKITFYSKARYRLTFTAPSSSYEFTLGKYRGENNPETIIQKNESFNTTKVLDAGTYYFVFSLANVDNIDPDHCYVLKASKIEENEPQADLCSPYTD